MYRRLNLDAQKIIADYSDRHYSALEIAEALSVDPKTITKILRAHGIVIRTRGECAQTERVRVKFSVVHRKPEKMKESKSRPPQDGPNNNHWKGGRGAHGAYVYVCSGSGRRVGEHRATMERIIGRKLRRGELIHHINGNGADNRPENLQIVTGSEHVRIHRDTEVSEKVKREVE